MREDKKNMLKTSSMVYKTLVVGVIVLFIGVGIQPILLIIHHMNQVILFHLMVQRIGQEVVYYGLVVTQMAI